MTVSSTNSRLSYNGDGVSVNFATPYFLANADIKVYVGGVLKTLTTDYTLTGAGTESGGTCSFLSAPASGTGNVVILRDPDQLQSTDLPSNDPFPSSSVEKAFDKLTMLVQRCRDLLGRSFTLQDSDTSGASVTMPTPTAGKLLAWASDGLSIVNSAPTGVVAGSITATELASDAVEEDAILNGAVTTNKLGALAVTAAKLAADAVETAKIKDANVTAAKLAADAVETAKIKDANVTAAKLAADLVNALASGIPDGTDEFLFGVAGGSGVKKAAALTMKGYFSKAKAGTFAKPGGTGNSAVTGVGFTPKAIFIFAAVPGGGSRGSIGFGADAAGRGAFYYDTGNVGLTLSAILYAGSAADLTSLDSDGFTLNWSNVGTTLTLAYLALGN